MLSDHWNPERAGSGNRNVHAAANQPMNPEPRISTAPIRKNTRFATKTPVLTGT
jgi:hypothetical protein